MRIGILKTGSYIDKEYGFPMEVTGAYLDKMISDYNPRVYEAPVTIGEVSDESPAWAWVKSLEREGNTLYAELRGVIPEFEEMLRKGSFPKRSISFTLQGELQRVGFLGADPPKIPAFENFQFSGRKHRTFEFSENEVMRPGERLSALTYRKIENNPGLSFSEAFSIIQIEYPILAKAYQDDIFS